MISAKLLIFAWIAGLCVFLGGFLAYLVEKHLQQGQIKQHIIHSCQAWGAGILLSAVALVLIPQGVAELNLLPILIFFVTGIVVFAFLDAYFARHGGQVGTLLAMLMDFIPEAIALGALFAVEPKVALLLALFIGFQNLPEAFNAYRDLIASGLQAKLILSLFLLLSSVGVISAVLGQLFLSQQPGITAAMMVFASGGILFLMFDDLAPSSKMENSNLPAKMASLGFLLGIIGEKIV